MTHPYVLHMTSAVWAARDALGAVDAVIRAEATTRVPIGPRSSTSTPEPRGYRSGPRSITRLSALIHSRDRAAERTRERTGQLINARSDIHPIGATAAPVRAELLDLQRTGVSQLRQTLRDCAWILASSLRTHPLRLRDGRLVAVGASPAEYYLRAALPYATPAVASEVLSILDGHARALYATLRLDPPRRQVPGTPECPACGALYLRAACAGPRTAWTVVCAAGCECAGDACGCGMSERAEGVRHVWPLDQVWQATAA